MKLLITTNILIYADHNEPWFGIGMHYGQILYDRNTIIL